ncbi:unnamed protein product [Caenorhabditis nigoni]
MQGRRSARNIQKRSQTSDRSQNVASKKMKKADSPVQIYKVQSLYRNGVDLLLRSDEPHAEEVIETIFTAFYKNVLPRVGLEQPKWENMDSSRLVTFLEKFDGAAEKFKEEVFQRRRALLTPARWQKVHLDSDSFKEGHLVTVLARMLSARDERVLKKHYKSFSSETYGATTTQQMKNILDQLNVTKEDVIIDLGSGIGQLVTFTASYADVQKTYGIEKCPRPAEIATRISENFKRLMAFFGKVPSPFELIEGDFLTDENKERIKKATIIIANNLLFDDKLMKKLKEIFYFCNSGTRIVVTKLIDNTRMTEDNFSEHFDSYSDTVPLNGINRQVEWTKNNVPFWVTTMDQEKVFRVGAEYGAQKEEQEAKLEAKRLTRAQNAEMRNGRNTSS